MGDSVLSATLETVAVAVHLQDVDVVSEAVQQGPGQALRAEDLGPLVEGQVGGHQDGAPLLALDEDLEDVEAFIRSILQCEGLLIRNLWMLAACLRTNDGTYNDACAPFLGQSTRLTQRRKPPIVPHLWWVSFSCCGQCG